MAERCEVKRCRAEAAITYLDHGVCEKHWHQFTADDEPPDALRIALGIEATASTATEDSTMEATSSKTPKIEAAAPSAATSKTTKPAKGTKAAPKTKTAKPKKASREPQVVFAFRLSEADRDRIHKAAGPAKATKFVRAAALAAANQDSKTFEELTTQAKANLK
jgi:hypothetical protein